jgi:hypothetical protein
LCLAMGPTPKSHFFLRTPKSEFKIPEIKILTTLEAHNFFFRLLIEMRSEAKL